MTQLIVDFPTPCLPPSSFLSRRVLQYRMQSEDNEATLSLSLANLLHL